MKTYKDFVEFVHKNKSMVWKYVIDEAAKTGFSRLQIWFYERRMQWEYITRPRLRAVVRRAGRAVWWCMIAAGAFFIFQRIDKLIETTIYKNQTIIARNALYSCQQMPQVCPSAAKVVESVMKGREVW